MRGIILGTVAGLVVGTLGAFAYSHHLYESQLEKLQADLAAANAELDKAKERNSHIKSEMSELSSQVAQLTTRNEELKQQDTAPKAPAPAAPTATPAFNINPMAIAGMMHGGFQGQGRLLLLKSRLHLTPEQEASVKTAIDNVEQQRRDMMRKMFQGGKYDPSAVGALPTLDQSLSSILTPDQMTAYQKVEADEKTSQAETSATVQLNQVAPLLQLSDSQKDQVYNALYQAQANAPDPATLFGNPNAASILANQQQATQAALAKILTPDQLALYQEQLKTMPRFGGGRGGGPR